ncbi:MAG: MFS transporter [Aigarchaeota archaeon]|nr:MFS transporter [Candidatus Geocrenenecus dongiae]
MLSGRILLLISFMAYVFYAILATEIGPALPEISLEFKLSEAITGIVVSLQFVAGILAVLGGFLSDIFGSVRFISISLGLIGVSALLLSYSTDLFIIGLAFFLMGTGFSFFEASVNAFISSIFSEKRGMSINLLHIGWGVGSTLGPVMIAFTILSYGSWRLGYLMIVPFMIFFSLVYGIFIQRSFKIAESGEELKRKHRDSGKSLLISVLPVFLTSFLLMSCKLGINTWLPYILQDQGGTIMEASLTISLFWMLISVGRLVWAPFVDRLGYWRVVTFTSLASLILLIPTILPIPLHTKMILYSSIGFFLGPIYPTLIAITTTYSPKRGGTLVGAIYAFGTLGTVFSTIITGFTIELFGSSIAQIIFPAILSLILATSYTSLKQLR